MTALDEDVIVDVDLEKTVPCQSKIDVDGHEDSAVWMGTPACGHSMTMCEAHYQYWSTRTIVGCYVGGNHALKDSRIRWRRL